MNKPAFYDWIDHRRAAERQHAEIARLTGVGTGRMAEIGSGDGVYLHYFQEHGWECLGIEMDSTLAERAMLDNQVITLQVHPIEAGIPRGSYDLIRIRGALGEDELAAEILRAAFEALIPTGYLIAEAWNGSGWPYGKWTRDLSRRFDKRTFPEFVQGAGFDIGGIIAPRLGDPVWFPLSMKGWRAAGWRGIPDAIQSFFDRGALLVLFGQKPG